MDQLEITSEEQLARNDAPERDMERHSLTIKQASHLFTQLGVPRAARSVQRFCELGLIDCMATTGEKGTARYFVNPQSVKRYADELRQLQTISHVGDDAARNDAPQRDTARNDAPSASRPIVTEIPGESDHAEVRLREHAEQLERENFQLRIDSAARAEVINQMRDHERTWLIQLTEQSREIGRLEMQVQQLAAPKEDLARNDAPEAVTPVQEPAGEGMVVGEAENAPTTVTRPQPEKRKRWWSL